MFNPIYTLGLHKVRINLSREVVGMVGRGENVAIQCG